VWLGVVPRWSSGRCSKVALQRGVYTPFQAHGASTSAMVIVSLGMTLILEFGLPSTSAGNTRSYQFDQGATLGGGCGDLVQR